MKLGILISLLLIIVLNPLYGQAQQNSIKSIRPEIKNLKQAIDHIEFLEVYGDRMIYELKSLKKSLEKQKETKYDDRFVTCHMHFKKNIEYKSTMDLLEVSVGEGPCYSATFSIIIKSKQGEILYSYNTFFSQLTAVPWDADDMGKVAEDLIHHLLSKDAPYTDKLPQFLPAEEYYEMHYNTVKITKEEYQNLKSSNVPYFIHPNHYEGWQYVYYDKEKKKSVIFIYGGL